MTADADQKRRERGKLVSIEGVDGAGKSTLLKGLANVLRPAAGPLVLCAEKMSPWGHLLADERLRDLTSLEKTYLFASDRAHTYERMGKPALDVGRVVIWDRYVDSALAYRLAELAFKPSPTLTIDIVRAVNSAFPPPDLVLYLEASDVNILHRKHSKQAYPLEHYRRVRAAYAEVLTDRRVKSLDANRPVELVVEEAARLLRESFPEVAW